MALRRSASADAVWVGAASASSTSSTGRWPRPWRACGRRPSGHGSARGRRAAGRPSGGRRDQPPDCTTAYRSSRDIASARGGGGITERAVPPILGGLPDVVGLGRADRVRARLHPGRRRARPPPPAAATARTRRCPASPSPHDRAVGGLSPVVSGRVQRYARRAGIPFGLWSGEIARIADRQPRARRRQRRRLVRGADFAIAYGSLAARYLAEQAPELPVALARNTSVLRRLTSGGPMLSRWTRDGRGPCVAEKGCGCARRGAARIAEAGCRLTVMGDGGCGRGWSEKRHPTVAFGLPGHYRLPTWVPGYAESDVFLFPSRSDVFGLVLVEAMSRGLPSVVSSAVGAVPDVAVPGQQQPRSGHPRAKRPGPTRSPGWSRIGSSAPLSARRHGRRSPAGGRSITR